MSGTTRADTLNWNTRPATNLRTGGTDNFTYGTVPAQITVSTSGSITGAFDAAGANILAIEPAGASNGTTGFVRTTMNASVDNESVFQTTTINFTEPVYNVSVIVGDIDGGPTFNLSGAAFNDIIEFRAVNVAGATILPTSGTPASAAVTWVAGTGRALSTNTNITDLTGNVTVAFAGPIRSFTIRHIAGANSTTANPTQQFVFIETVTYTRSPLLTVQKTSLNGTGTFSFDRSNSLNTGTTPWTSTTTSTSVTTVTAGVPVTGSPGILFATSTATTLTETAPAGWDITSSPVTCTDAASATSGNPASFSATVSGLVVTVAAANIRAGANITCAITDNRRPILTLVKTVTNDNGGTQAVSAWTLTATGPSTISGASGTAAVTSVPVSPGSYALSETGPSGYTAGAWSCTAGVLVGSNLTLAYGQTATCTINNNDIAPVLTLVKTVTNDNGGTSLVSAWTLTATGPTTISGASGTAAVTNANVNAGTYTLSETGPAGYTAGAWSCTAGTLSGSNLTLTPGQNATCTINNNDTAPRLTLVKTVTNDNGGTEVVGAWTLTATGPVTISGASGSAAVTNAAVNVGTYALSESGPIGYTASAWSCTAGTLVGANLTLALGQTATCTINNNDISPVLTLVKTVTNDNGGTSVVSAWTLTATGPTTISGASGTAAVTNANVNAGAYALSETGPAGYAAGAWSCTAGTLVGANLTLALAQTATCTINNNDISPVLTLVKTVTNDNGGTSVVSAWTLTATGPTTISGASGAAAVTNANVNAGIYALSEAGPAGYAASAWSCSAGTLVGSNLTLALAQTATCTINNNDISPVLTLVKTVTNDNGGTSVVSAWTLTAAGPTTISGASGAAAVTNANVNAGTYALTESGPAGYAASAWSCSAGTLVGANLTLTPGQTSTCTINNNDISPVLTLVKTVTNDNGGTQVVAAWTLTATGPTTISGASGTAAVTNANVNAGSYALSESGPAGYAASAWSCTAGALTGSNLALSVGQTSTCTINNNDIAATLTLVKVIDGDITPSDVPNFTLTATGPTTISGSTGAVAVTNASVSAGSYTLSESGPAGYFFDTVSCTAGTLSGTSLTLPLATAATCTLTNYRIPTFAVQKITTGGTGGPFSFSDTGVIGSFSDITTSSAGVATPASPTSLFAAFGTPVTITESMSLAWITSGITCSDANAANTGNSNPVATSATGSVSIAAAANRKGAIITCVFSNAAAAPSLAMSKTPNVASINAAGQTITYSILVSNTGNTMLGPITVSDALGSVTCPSSGGTTVTSLVAGANETCSFSYVVPQLVLDNNGGGDGDIDNTASSAVTYNGSPVNSSANATVALVITPSLVIDKFASTAGPVNANDVYTYTFRVRNTGNVTIAGVVVNDTFNGYGVPPVPGSEAMFADAAPLGDSSDGGTNGSWDTLAPGDEIAFTASYTVVQGDIDNP